MRQPNFALAPLAQACLSALLALGLAGQAQAQGSPAARVTLTIAAQPLGMALNELARQANLQLLFPPALVAGKTAGAVSGHLTPGQALDRLLAGSGLVATHEGSTIVIKAAPAPGNVATLAAVTVTAQAGPEGTTEGTASYTQTGPSTTATGLALTLRETPQSVSVVTRQKMDDFKLETLKDVMNQTPGVSVSTQGDSIRFWARGGEINNYLVDGMRSGQSVASTGVPVGTNLLGDDLAEMDRVEVLKGSAGLLQGDGYPTATVNMIRKKPTREFQAQVGAGLGSWNSRRGDLDIGGALTERGNVRGRLVAAVSDADAFRDNAHNESALLYGALEVDLAPSTLLNLGATYRKLKNAGNSAFQGYQAYDVQGNYLGDVARSWNAAAPWSGYEQEKHALFGSVEHHLADGWKSSLGVSHDTIETPLFELGAYHHRTLARAVRATDVKSTTDNAKLEFSGPVQLFGRRHELVLGADYSTTDYRAAVSDRRALDYTGLPYAAGGAMLVQPSASGWATASSVKEKTVRRAAYATGRFHLMDDLKLITGLRMSDYEFRQNWYALSEKREKGVVTPFAGLVWDLNQNVSLYASYASVFQPVTVQDEQGKVLDPQEGVTYELGSKAAFLGGKLNVGAALFWKRWENTYEASGGLTPTGASAYRNVSGVMERGYELEASGELRPGWQVQGSFVQNVSSIADTYFPKQQVKLHTSYRLSGALNPFTIGGGARWQSGVATSTYARLAQPAYVVVDAMLRYELDKQLSLQLNVNNLFDKKYYAGVNTMGSWGEFYDWGAPRSVNVSARYKF